MIRSDKDDADLTVRTDAEALFARVARDYGQLDVVVANAGVPYGLSTQTATQHE